ncbi:P-loop containing nucleoside triphosphate hydrolase protein [Fomitopsis serialis]|uniref:P-loop containing nucleoside triphosphate hydrolase protein n=1 Tax=Fomitopsis serialis TaxID=139415 RepID=UPI002007AC13|nr:P-loop containing nucleoside triphosphate hydrolase protein [Neoantrodia serialis]KAH9925149.1 P-loop containing nucleoside triphosphate hydrolase protein [Neoantrodia serialis]
MSQLTRAHILDPAQPPDAGPPPAPSSSNEGRRPHIPSTAVRCDICSILLDDMQAYRMHMQGGAHKRALTELAVASASSGYIRCPICERDLPAARWGSHVEGDQYHRRRQQYADVTAQTQSAQLNRNGVSVTGEAGGIDFGTVEVDSVHAFSAECTLEVTVSNDDPGTLISLALIKFSSSYRGTQSSRYATCPTHTFSAVLRGASRFVNDGKPRTVLITFHSSYVGRFEDMLEFEFHDVRRKERFVILRRVQAVVGPAADYDALKSKGPYRRPIFRPLEPTPHAVPTRRPPTWSKVRWAVKLPEFPVPKALADVLNAANVKKTVGEIRGRFMPGDLNMGTYGKFWSTLLHSEEWQQRFVILNMPVVSVDWRTRIPGLREDKPIVRVGDNLLVCKQDFNIWHEAVVHEDFLPELLVDVKFQLNRMPWRRRQQAVVLDNNQSRILFPTSTEIGAFDFNDQTLIDNPEQKEVVAAISNALQAAPGTGKTVTWSSQPSRSSKQPEARLLMCAPTNIAADQLAFKLREWAQCLWHARGFLHDNGNRVYAMPEAEVLKSFRVVVTTCVSAAVPHGLGLASGWFTHVFVDEAGHSRRREHEHRSCGDTKQLGPVIHSSIARQLGLGMPVYDLSAYRGITITKLVKHFRSHPAIIAMLRSTCLDGLTPKFPIVFHGVGGRDEQEEEASLVAKYCEELIKDRKVPLNAKDIGIISPYTAQCGKIRALLRRSSTRLEGVKVGTTELFQGQERRVIIISTVRSNPAHALRDVRQRLGFVGDPQRFNGQSCIE